MDTTSQFNTGQGFVFDGIAACIEHSIPSTHEIPKELHNKQNDDSLMSVECATMFVELLCKFVSGEYKNDVHSSTQATFYLENVYNYRCHFSNLSKATRVLRAETTDMDILLWEKVLLALNFISISSDMDASLKGIDSFQRILLQTKIDSVPSKSWLFVLDLISEKHPPVENEAVRVKAFDLFIRMLLMHVPNLCKESANMEALTSITHRMATLIAENLSVGRQGNISALFESTVQLVTNLSNVLLMPEFSSEPKFTKWAGNYLFEQLDKNGVGGGSARMMNATSSRETQDV